MIIGINGPKGAGKNEVANFLVKNHGFEAMGFADKLKESAAALFGIDSAHWDFWKNLPEMRIRISRDKGSQSFNVVNISAREFLQRYGTEAHRDVFGYEFWVDEFFKPYMSDEGDFYGPNLAISDARFDNELKRIRDLKGTIVRVERPGLETSDNHVSEASPSSDLIDYVIVNSGTLDDLEAQVDIFMEHLLGKQTDQGQSVETESLAPSL